MLNIVWFKRDLRVHDHAPLSQAAAMGSVLPIYIAEPGLWAGPDASARQWDFVAECLASLQSDLGRPGLPLRILLGEAVPVLQALSQQHRIAALWSHEETGNAWTFARDRRVAAWAKAAGIAWHEMRQTGVIRRLKSRDGWAKAWDAEMAKPVTPPALALTGPAGDWPTRVPVARDLGLADDPCPQRQASGRAAGRQGGRTAGRQGGRTAGRQGGGAGHPQQLSDRAGPRLPLADVQPGDGVRRKLSTVAASDLGHPVDA